MTEDKKKKIKVAVIVVAIAVVAIGVLFGPRIIDNLKECKAEGCVYDSQKAEHVGKSKYCSDHTCDEGDCTEQVKGEEDYCKEHLNNHSCEGGYECTNKAIKGYDVCEEHACAVDGCYNEIYGDDKHCTSHQCVVCDAPVKEYGNKCSKHKGYEKCLSCDKYKTGVSLRTIAGGDTQDYKGEKYEWCTDCWEEYKELSIYD